jgi:hypothetical protein
MQFYILMIDYSDDRTREAIVNPEHTCREIVSQVRDIMARNRDSIEFVKFVDGNFIEDVTAEICGEASFDNAMAAIEDALSAGDMQPARWDHDRDMREHA